MKRERGSITIEAALALSLFMFAFLTIAMLATVAKVESLTQYAIDQVAKEVAQYYYIAERVGLAQTNTSGVEEVDDAIDSVLEFTDVASRTAGEISSSTSMADTVINTVSGISNNYTEIRNAGQRVYNSARAIADDPVGIVKSLIRMGFSTGANEVMSRAVSAPLSKMLFEKYIATNGDPNTALMNMGVVDGLEGIDFGLSSFLRDQRSINIVIFYKVKVPGFGVFKNEFLIKQTASTAAWIKNAEIPSADNPSKWQDPVFVRGKEFVEALKNDDSLYAVKNGVGIDSYNQEKNEFATYHSINVFSASYSDYSLTGLNPDSPNNYFIKKDKVKDKIKSYADELKKNIENVGDTIKLEDGTECHTARDDVQKRTGKVVIVLPVEAKANPDNLDILNEIAREIKAETGVEVHLTYRENAL